MGYLRRGVLHRDLFTVSAALAALALETGTDKQLRRLAYLILALCLIAVCISLVEGRVQQEFLPQAPLEDLSAAQIKVQQEFGAEASEFRGPAFYSHPLTGALVTSMALFLVIGMRLRWWFVSVRRRPRISCACGPMVCGSTSWRG